jgi:preprotein translocase subunit YajC
MILYARSGISFLVGSRLLQWSLLFLLWCHSGLSFLPADAFTERKATFLMLMGFLLFLAGRLQRRLAFAYERLLKAFFPEKERSAFPGIGGLLDSFLRLVAYLTNLTRPYFYEDATSSAFMCHHALALLNLAYSGFFDKEKTPLRWWLLGFTGFWLALAVLSRATMALYAVAFVVMLVVYHLRHRERQPRQKKRDSSLLRRPHPYASFCDLPMLVQQGPVREHHRFRH